MNQIDKNQIIKMVATLVFILVIVGIATHFRNKNSITLDEYAKERAKETAAESIVASSEALTDISANDVSVNDTVSDSPKEPAEIILTGAYLNGGPDGKAMIEKRFTYAAAGNSTTQAFYSEPLSDNLRHYITGTSYPSVDDPATLQVSLDDLAYVHVMHYDFEGEVTQGELICNQEIANDLLEIFYELYKNEYQIEKIILIDEYNGDDTASMEDNNTSCFNYRVVEGTSSLSKHALGLALDINPFYNPYITYNADGSVHVSPEAAESYANRNAAFPYKIDENDLCYKLFTQHGFTWGGNWNSVKDYQHFQKTE